MKATRYLCKYRNVRIELKNDKTDSWGILSDSEMRLSKKGKWDYEPLPSSRTDEYIKEHSFTFDEAVDKCKELGFED